MSFEIKPVFVFLALCVFAACSHATDPQVHTSLGTIKGSFMETVLKKKIFAFRGIRFAKSTAGKRRFKVCNFLDLIGFSLDHFHLNSFRTCIIAC